MLQFRSIWKEAIMDRESNELVELGSVSADTAGSEDVGIETNGKFRPLGLSQD